MEISSCPMSIHEPYKICTTFLWIFTGLFVVSRWVGTVEPFYLYGVVEPWWNCRRIEARILYRTSNNVHEVKRDNNKYTVQ